MGSYYSVGAPSASAGFLMQPESKIKIGTAALYASLEHTSWTYITYEASIGLQAGTSFELGGGDLLSFGVEHNIGALWAD